MRRAIELAKRAGKSVANNPMVGAVIVLDNKIIGEGWHQQYGSDHAEIMALKSVKPKDHSQLSEATIYVTLEPCAHYGKTPPCAEALVKAGIKKVVIAITDPSEKVSNKGIAILKKGGIDVEIGLLSQEARGLADHFFINELHHRPKVILKFAQSKDGFVGSSKKAVWITNGWSKRLVHRLRAVVGAIMVGANTVRIDDPKLTTRFGFGTNPIRVVPDAQLKLMPQYRILSDGLDTILLTQQKNHPADDAVSYSLYVETADFFPNLFKTLLAKKVNTLLVEGGPTLLQQFIDSGYWDEAWILTSEQEMQNGVSAPRLLQKELRWQETLETDQIEIFANPAPASLGSVNEG